MSNISLSNKNNDVFQISKNLINIPSVSGQEKKISNFIEDILRSNQNIQTHRIGNSIIAFKKGNKNKEKIILAGHLDTVPFAKSTKWKKYSTKANILNNKILQGRGSVDMKCGVAIQLSLALIDKNPKKDILFIFYDQEEVHSSLSGLRMILNLKMQKKINKIFNISLKDFNLAIILEPTNKNVELGCNGTLRFLLNVSGKAAHSARSWMGKNAIHKSYKLLFYLNQYIPKDVIIDNLKYKEGLNAVRINGGIAGNVIPDNVNIEINYRFAPNKTLNDAIKYIKSIFYNYKLSIIDAVNGAKPNLNLPIILNFLNQSKLIPMPKFGWTDVARFYQKGIPAINFGPGNPLLAHSDDEHIFIKDIYQCFNILKYWIY